MKSQALIYIFCLILILGCEETIKSPIIEEDKYYSVEGNIYFESIPIQGVEVFLELLTSLSDSNGHFKFDSVKAGQGLLIHSHPKYIPSDTLLNIDRNIIVNITLTLRSDSFYPCNIGNRWFYKDLNRDNKLIVEVIDSIQIENEIYYKFLYTEFGQSFIDTSKFIFLRQMKADTLYEYGCNEIQLFAPFVTMINQEFFYKRCYSNSSTTYDGQLYAANNDTLKYYYQARFSLDADLDISFQRGIGIIKYQNPPWTNYILEKYEIKY